MDHAFGLKQQNQMYHFAGKKCVMILKIQTMQPNAPKLRIAYLMEPIVLIKLNVLLIQQCLLANPQEKMECAFGLMELIQEMENVKE